MSAVTTARAARVVRRSPIGDALETFSSAHLAAEEARANLTRAQAAGVEELPPGVEFLFAEADARFEALWRLLGDDASVRRMAEAGCGEDVAPDYIGRRRVSPKPASSGDWRESVGSVDWSRGRGAA